MSAVRFRHMSADRQLEVGRAYPALLPALLLRGMSIQDAAALAHNAAFLYYALELAPALSSPQRVLERFSLKEIAWLCELCAEREDAEPTLHIAAEGTELEEAETWD